jgi:hypothetical protein
MPLNTKEILSIVTQITQDKHVRVTVGESVKGGCITGATAAVGGLLLGPVGLPLGGIVGGFAAYLMSKDQFKSLPEVIMYDMTNAQREQLAARVAAVIEELRVEDIVLLLPLLLKSPGAKAAVLKTVFAFVQNEMQLQIVD